MSMGSKLAQARRKNNLTQEQLAEKLGVTRQAVSRWESDAAYPETDKIVRLSPAAGGELRLGCSRRGRRPPPPPAERRRPWSPACWRRRQGGRCSWPFMIMKAAPSTLR